MPNYAKVLNCYPESAGESFMPSNGTEGMIFTDAFCEQCLYERWMHHIDQDREDDKCKIFNESIMGDNPPKEWQYDKDGWPHCTKWVQFDWEGNDDDPDSDDPNLPKPISIGPNQLSLFPLTPTEQDFNDNTRRIQTGPETRKEREKETATHL